MKSVLGSAYADLEVVFVDNGSTDGSLEEISHLYGDDARIKIVLNGRNLGFAEGNNTGARHARGEFLVFLNLDTEVEPNWISHLISPLHKQQRVGICQSKILVMDSPNIIDNMGHTIDRFGTAYMLHRFERDTEPTSSTRIFGATAVAIAIKRATFFEAGGFDADFFMTFEDTDLSWRVRVMGYEVLVEPRSVVYHAGSAFSSRLGSNRLAFLFVRNRIFSMIKNYSIGNVILYLPINILMMTGYAVSCAAKRDPRKALAILQAIREALANVGNVLPKRALIQSKRRVPDSWLFRSGLISSPNMVEMIRRSWN